jgi:large subunit ribosomal protein L3
MKFLLATKQEMTQVFDADGRAHAATLVSAGPCVVTHIKTKEKDGYTALALGFAGPNSMKKELNKALSGHFKELGKFRYVREVRVTPEEAEAFKVGDTVNTSIFTEGDVIAVSGISKGKGFQGVVKRHGFHGGRRSHGQKHSEREPGSIGGGGRAGGRVAKGMRMAGRMGSDRVTVRHLKVLRINPETNEVYIRGAVPGRRGTLLEIKG